MSASTRGPDLVASLKKSPPSHDVAPIIRTRIVVGLNVSSSSAPLDVIHPMSSDAPLPSLPSAPRPGRYRHYKGNLYEVTGLARHSEDLSVLVLYRPIDASGRPTTDSFWVRPHAMWSELVVHAGITQTRFTPVT